MHDNIIILIHTELKVFKEQSVVREGNHFIILLPADERIILLLWTLLPLLPPAKNLIEDCLGIAEV